MSSGEFWRFGVFAVGLLLCVDVLAENELDRLDWAGGSVYFGEVRDGKANGLGEVRRGEQVLLRGHFIDDKPHGRMVAVTPRGHTIYSFWSQGKMVSKWLPETPTGPYKGDVDELGRRHGMGLLLDGQGGNFYGEWSEDFREGFGVYVRPESAFIGKYRAGNIEEGTMVTSDGLIRSGEWEHGRLHGNGVQVYAERSIYIGRFFDGIRHGRGVMVFPDGSIFRGVFRHGVAVEGGCAESTVKDECGEWLEDK